LSFRLLNHKLSSIYSIYEFFEIEFSVSKAIEPFIDEKYVAICY
jgi:hypothetical protein